jgi:outer membrane protein
MMTAANILLLLVLQSRTVTLDEAVRTAEAQQPQLRQAQANRDAAAARADQARAPLLPEVKVSAEYQRTTGNREHKPGSATTVVTSDKTYNWYDVEATGAFVLWDFGQRRGRWQAEAARAQGLTSTEGTTRLQVVLNVRTAYFRARAQRALVSVARGAFENQERHLAQITGFVKAGTRPTIDLAQANADRANARVQLINAEDGYAVARAQLNEAMGVAGAIDYDVGDETFGQVAGEAQPIESLVEEALRARPDFAALDNQVRAEELARGAARAGYWPTLSLIGGASEQGTDLTRTTGLGLTSSAVMRMYTSKLAWNYFGGLNLTWPIFQGLVTPAQVRETDAVLRGLRAQRDALTAHTWVTVQQAVLGVRAAQESLIASGEGLTSARQRLALAEGRYEAGAGSAIELGDAQLGAVTAEAQKVGAEYRLASARAELLFALGRR